MILPDTPYFRVGDRVKSQNAQTMGTVEKTTHKDRHFIKWDNGRSGWTQTSVLILVERQIQNDWWKYFDQLSENIQKELDKHGLKLGLQSGQFEHDHSWFVKHIPTGEDWYVIGIDFENMEVCAAGWPPSIGKISDCKDFTINKPLTEDELKHRKRRFGSRWI